MSVFIMTQETKLCNCAGCGQELLGESQASAVALAQRMHRNYKPPRPLVCGRINGRPYCSRCLETTPQRGRDDVRDDESPSQADAVRALEDAAS